jgi:hypothetical protein
MGAGTEEFRKEEWQAALEGLSERCKGWAATIEVMGESVGDQPVAENIPLQGLSYETKGSAAGHILVEAGDRPDTYMVHHVTRPRSVRVAFTRPGSEADVELVSDDGTTTLVTLRPRSELPPRGAGRDR